MAGIAGDNRLRARIEQEVNDLMAPLAKWEQVKKITILPAPFTIDGGELTPTLKLKRKPIMAKYGDAAEAMRLSMLETLNDMDTALFLALNGAVPALTVSCGSASRCFGRRCTWP